MNIVLNPNSAGYNYFHERFYSKTITNRIIIIDMIILSSILENVFEKFCNRISFY